MPHHTTVSCLHAAALSGVTFRFAAISHCYCRVGALSCTDYFCLHMLTKLFNSDSICYNRCRWHCTWSIFQYSRISSPQNFLFICLSFPAFFCVFVPAKNLAYIYSFTLSVYTVFDVSYLTLLEHKLSCLSGLFIAFCAVLLRITSFLSSSLKHSLRFDVHTNHLVCTNDINKALPSNG